MKRFKQMIAITCSLLLAMALSACSDKTGGDPIAPAPSPTPISLSLTNAPQGVFYYNEYYDTVYLGVEISDDSTQSVAWESSDTKIAEVNEKGVVTVCGEGSVVIKATLETDASVFASVQLTTKYSVVNVTGRPANDQIDIHAADEIKLGYSFSDENITGEVVWRSSNESVLTVDENGKVEVCGLGVATINVYLKDNPNIFYAFDLTVIDSNYSNEWYESFTTASVVGTNCIGKVKIIGYNLTDMELVDDYGKKALVISGNDATSNNAFITVSTSNLIAGNDYRLTVEYELLEGVHTLDVYRFDSLTTEKGETTAYSTEFFASSPSWKFKISSSEKSVYRLKIKSVSFKLIDGDNVLGGEDIFE